MGIPHTRRRTLPSPQLSPTFERRRTQIMENREQHVRQPQLAPTYERRQTTQVIENQGRHVRQPVYLPKGLQYDGTTIIMHGAGCDMKMKTFIIEPIDIGIGTRTYSSEVYIAPMDDDILLVLDFMRRNHVQLDCC